MKKLVSFCLAALLFCGAAHADEAFDGFRNFCLAGRGASATALAAADAAGWMAVPQQFLSQLPQNQFQNPQGRMRTSSGGAQLLITAQGTLPQAGPVSVCAIGVVPAGVSDLAGQLAAALGVPKQDVPNLPEGMYAWREVGGARVSLDRNAPDFRAQVTGGALIATTRNTPQMSMILLMSSAQ